MSTTHHQSYNVDHLKVIWVLQQTWISSLSLNTTEQLSQMPQILEASEESSSDQSLEILISYEE